MGCIFFTLLPMLVYMAYSAWPAYVSVLAVCWLVLNYDFMMWFIGITFILGYCCPLRAAARRVFDNDDGDGNTDDGYKTVIRTFLYLDAIAVGVCSVWGNYLQSGIVAAVFGLVPAFNIVSTSVQCCLFQASSEG